jgi:hypothetical protein
MTPNRNRRLPQDDLQADRHALIGVQSLLDYAPSSGAYCNERAILPRMHRQQHLKEVPRDD